MSAIAEIVRLVVATVVIVLYFAAVLPRMCVTPGASILNRIADLYQTNLRDVEAAVATPSRISRNWPGTKLAEREMQRIEGIKQRMQSSPDTSLRTR